MRRNQTLPHMKKSNFLLNSCLTAAALALGGSVAFAASESFSAGAPTGGGSFAFDFGLLTPVTLDFPKFDPSLGTLTSISLTLSGTATAQQDFENKSNSSATVTMTSAGTMTLKRPNGTQLVVTIPTVINSKTVGAYDHVNDSGGTSGFTFDPTTVTASDLQVYSGASDLALFTGVGNISLPFTGIGSSTAVGSASLSTGSSMIGSASATVLYTFTAAAAVPETSTYGSIGAVAIVGLLGYRRARSSAAKSE